MKKTENLTVNPNGADASCVLEELRSLTASERRELLRILTGRQGLGVARRLID